MKKFIKNIYFLLLIGPAASCVGTDFISDPESAPQNGRVEIQDHPNALMINETYQFNAVAYNPDENIDPEIIIDWSSSDENVASINGTGLLTAVAEGQTWVSAEGGNYSSDSILISVVADTNQLASIEVEPGNSTIGQGQQINFTATGYNVNGTPIQNMNFGWSSTNSLIVSVDDNGTATGVSSGSSEIYAFSGNIESNRIIVDVIGNSRAGTFTNNPSTNYNVSGSATLSKTSNGTVVLSFGQDFSSSNGPGLYVYLSKTQSLSSDHIEVSSLRSTSGAQTYNISQNIQLADYDYVLIHCKPFNVTFGYAKLN